MQIKSMKKLTWVMSVMLLVGLLGVKNVEAATMSRAEMLSLLQSLLKQLAALQQQLAEVQAKESYQDVNFETYLQNPAAYLGKKVSIVSVRNNFLPKGAGGGNTNFISALTPNSNSFSEIMMRVDDQVSYTNAVSGLQDNILSAYVGSGVSGPVIALAKFYGTGSVGEEFKNQYGVAFQKPVVSITRIDRCIKWSSEFDLSACSEWKQITPIISNVTANPTTNNPPLVISENPRHFVLSGQGFCLQNPGVSYIRLGGTYYIPDKNVDSWDGGRVSFTAPDSIPKGNYDVLVVGYNPNSGYCAGVNASRIDVP